MRHTAGRNGISIVGKKRVLFLIHDLGPGGAEKVLVDLANGMDKDKFDISVRTLFDWGPNKQFLDPDVSFSSWISRNIPANSHWMKLLTPEQLWKMIVPEPFDIAVSFLEGPCSRVTGGCPADGPKIADWIHTPILNEKHFTEGFRGRKEAERCYDRADALVFVSSDVRDAFFRQYKPHNRTLILYNIFDGEKIRKLAAEEPTGTILDDRSLNWCSVGKLIPLKGWDRMLKIQKRLLEEGIPAHFYLIGDGPQRRELEQMADKNGLRDAVTFTGYQTNPYALVARCALYVCASEREGFSTAAVESLLAGTPVCTVDVGGMKDILGKNGEYGVVTANEDEALYTAVRRFFTDPAYLETYRTRARERGMSFDRQKAVDAVESLLLSL